jgi:hypothetical protein
MIGKKFGRLTIVKILDANQKIGRRERLMICRCDCGKIWQGHFYKIKSGHTKSCGCYQREWAAKNARIHGKYYEPEFQAWKDMIERCTTKRWARWYGDVVVCKKWKNSYNAFLKDVGKRPSKKYSLDRVNTFGHYEPGNVRWTTRSVQSRNTKNHCTNKTGTRGVSFSNQKLKFRAHISVKNRSVHLGYFDKIEAAIAARVKGEKKYWKNV